MHPDAFKATSNIPVETEVVRATSETTDFPKPKGPASGVAEPKFPSELSGYRYLLLTHEVPLIKSGTYSITADGKPVEITFDVSSGRE